MSEWMSDPKRSRMAREGLNRRAKDLHKIAKELHMAFKEDYMNEPCQWTAGVYDRAAAILEVALAEIAASSRDPVDYEQAGLDESGHPIPPPDEEWK